MYPHLHKMLYVGDTSTVPVDNQGCMYCVQDAVQLHDPILSDEARGVLEIIFYIVLNGPIGVLGSAANVINIIVFCKQGLIDSVNISLCALAVSDLGSLLPPVWVSICVNPLFQRSDIGFDPVEVQYLTGGLPHSCLARITGLITALITFERCVCVALPMKVKDIVTPKRTLVTILAMFAIILSANAPLYLSVFFTPTVNTKRNLTLAGLVFTGNFQFLENFSFSCNVSAQLTSFIIVVICTAILVLKLLEKSQWRQKVNPVSDVSDSISSRDKRVMKMVTSISIIFIVCYLPTTINLILIIHFSSEYKISGKYENSYYSFWAIINTIEVINSSVTILVYYNMSSKFRATFNELFLSAAKNNVVNI